MSLVREAHGRSSPDGDSRAHRRRRDRRSDIGDVLRLEDVPSTPGVTFLDDPHETVIATESRAPRVEVEAVAAEAEAGEEVEGEPVSEGEEAADEAGEALSEEASSDEAE